MTPSRGDQRVDGQQAQRGRAVDEDVVVVLLRPAVQDLAQGMLAADAAEELVLGGREVDVRGRHVDVLGAGRFDDVLERERGVQQHVGDGDLDVPGVEAEPDGEVGLRVHVDAQDTVTELGQRASQIDGGGRLAHATLLVRDRDRCVPTSPPGCAAGLRWTTPQPPMCNLPNGASAHHAMSPRVETSPPGAPARSACSYCPAIGRHGRQYGPRRCGRLTGRREQ